MFVVSNMYDEKLTNIVCRVCLNDSVNCKFLTIFEKLNDDLIVEKIGSIANVEIEEGDGLPDKICPECLLELENAIHFKRKCENSNAILRNIKLLNNGALDIKQEVQNECDEHIEHAYEYLEDESENKCTLTNQIQTLTLPIKIEGIVEDCVPVIFERPSRVIDLKLECHDCGGIFPSKCKLRVHWKKVHIPKLMCDKCKRIFKSFKAYHHHRKKPTANCQAVSQSRIEGEGRSRIFYCKSCAFKTSRAKDVAIHMRTHSGERPFECDKCHRKFSQQCSLQDHMETAHKLIKHEYTCQHCGKFIKGRHKFYSHMRIHKTTGGQCHICSKNFTTRHYLLTHMLRHGETKQCACEYCAATFYTSSELRNHIIQMHLKNKIYTCDICGYKATRNAIIKRHKSKHTDTNIPCLICGTFIENEQLFKVHEKRHLDRPHSCPHCDMNFHSKKNLSNHVRRKHVLLGGKLIKVVVKKEANSDVNIKV